MCGLGQLRFGNLLFDDDYFFQVQKRLVLIAMKIKSIFLTALIAGLIVVTGPVVASAHSGGTDANGCHAGSQPYHCHGSKSSSGTVTTSVTIAPTTTSTTIAPTTTSTTIAPTTTSTTIAPTTTSTTIAPTTTSTTIAPTTTSVTIAPTTTSVTIAPATPTTLATQKIMLVFKNCTEVRKTYRWGVAKSLQAAKKQKNYPLNNPFVSASIYTSLEKMDQDGDGTACEK